MTDNLKLKFDPNYHSVIGLCPSTPDPERFGNNPYIPPLPPQYVPPDDDLPSDSIL